VLSGNVAANVIYARTIGERMRIAAERGPVRIAALVILQRSNEE
jgi:hypothetical protein